MNPHPGFKNAIDDIELEAQRSLDSLAARYRSEVLLPICKRLGLRYLAGMGRTLFCDANEASISDADDARDAGYNELVDVFDMLNSPVSIGGSNQVFGYSVADIRAEDIR